MTVYCQKCGKPNKPEAKFCAACGVELPVSEQKARRFKGTMIMRNPKAGQSAEDAPQSEAAAPPAESDLAPTPSEPPVSQSAKPASLPARGRFKQTMIGSPLTLGDLPSSPPEAEAPAQSDHSFDDRFSEDDLDLPKKRNGCWGGLGCLAVITLLCCAGGWLFLSASIPFLMNEGGELAARASLIPLVQVLGKIDKACKNDGLKKGELIHPSAADGMAGEVCAMNSQAIIRSVAKTPAAEVLSNTPDRTYAENTNLSADQCYRFLSDDYKVIGCWENDQYRLLHIESFQ